MSRSMEIKQLLDLTDFSDAESIERYALHLEGMTFRDILDLGIHPDDAAAKDYSNTDFKGGMGNLIEERFFGYRSNNDAHADFPEAGVELKATCYDIRKSDNAPSAGERLVLSMIPFDRDVTLDFYSSHLWEKCQKILLVYYQRDKTCNKYDQKISRVTLFTPPEEDLRIIREDYRKIISYVQDGRADELSEGLTTYLGACTKGATAEKSWTGQHYPHVDPETGVAEWRKAKKRAFSLKRQYMDYILNTYILGKPSKAQPLALEYSEDQSFEEALQYKLGPFYGMTDRDIAFELNEEYNCNKAQWTKLVYRMLGIKNNRAEEFIKANISVRVSRITKNGLTKESLPFAPFEFENLLAETWETSTLREELESSKFLFVTFKETDDGYVLFNSKLWSMPSTDIEGPVRECWEMTRDVVAQGVKLTPSIQKDGKVIYRNDLPGASDNPVAHVRPHASKSAYLLEDGTRIGDIESDGSRLPDGRYMTKQSFWLNKQYLQRIIGAAE